MKKLWAFIVLLARQAMGTDPCHARPAGEADPLRAKIAKFKSYADEFARHGHPSLAAYYRESAQLYERELRLREFAQKTPAMTRRAA